MLPLRCINVLIGIGIESDGSSLRSRPGHFQMVTIHGQVAPGFEEVRKIFERNFAERGEIGAAVAGYWHGKKVVDL